MCWSLESVVVKLNNGIVLECMDICTIKVVPCTQLLSI